MNTILRRVRDVIKESGVSQTALEKAGVASQGAISGWLTRDDGEPSASSVAKLAMHLGINGHWLLTGQGDKWALEKGADAVRAAGILEGLALAEATIHKLRVATSKGGDGKAVERAVRDHQVARTVQPDQPRPRGQRRSGSQ